MPKLEPAEAKYYEMLRSGNLFAYWPHLSGIYADDQEKWLVIYKSFNS